MKIPFENYLFSFICTCATPVHLRQYDGISIETPRVAYAIRLEEGLSNPVFLIDGAVKPKLPKCEATRALQARFDQLRELISDYICADVFERSNLYWKIKDAL